MSDATLGIRPRPGPAPALVALGASLSLHGATLALLAALWALGWFAGLRPEPRVRPAEVMELVSLSTDDRSTDDPLEPEEEEPPEPEPEPPDPDLDGQIVEIAPPENPAKPEDSQYLAEYDSTVEEETRSQRFAINPEVLSPRFSEEQKIEMKGDNVMDLDVTRPSTGATAGNERFDPDRHGTLAALSSKWTVTNKPGLQDPVPASALQSVLAGAPQNDRLDEKAGAETALNAREFKYAGYLLRIRRLVNFYWNQNLDNLPSGIKLVKPEYTTSVLAVLDSSGALTTIEISDDSGSPELDDAVVRAFKIAGPYPNPPAGLISPDGTVHLPTMSFTVTLGVAQMRYEGIDPRAGVQFPGILKSPR